ncbi:GNAT family N-acetyltransferase (plasmid) [Streptomyces sp. NBC_00390]|uniref:GNAT family N-acetyltransferase n=1 Tax=Streptomyces sp. NBC_00390 TaxID=2975736 RepID=UPI002E24341E
MDTSDDVRITTVINSEGAEHALGEILPIYETVFAEPPYNEGPRDVADFLERFQRERVARGFRLVCAEQDGHPAGFAYGYPLQSVTTWWDGLLDAELEDPVTREDGHRTFVIMELAVLPDFRRRGLARHLHDGLVDNQEAERVTLAVRPEAQPALALYGSLGYQLVGHSRPWKDAPTYQVLLKNRST